MKNILILSIIFLIPSLLYAQPLSPLSLDGSWTTASSTGFTARYNLSSCVVDGKIYVIGGEGIYGKPFLNTLESFDPINNIWSSPTTTGTFPPHFGHTSSAVNGKIYVFGGSYTPTDFDTDIYMFDPKINTWSKVIVGEGITFTPRWNLTSCVLNGKIYVIGGDTTLYYPYPPSNIVEIFDPSTNSWSRPLATSDTMRILYFLTANVVNGKIYVIGTINDGKYSLIMQVFDPITSKWSTIEPTGSAGSRIHFTSSVVNNKIYVIGERKPDIEMFDPSTNTWTVPVTTGTFTERYYLTSSVVDGKIYAIGGNDSRSNFSNANEFFTPSTDEVKNENTTQEIKLFPNPTDGFVNITSTANLSNVAIVNLLGETVLEVTKPSSANFTIDLSKLAAGIYYAKFQTQNSLIVKKIVLR